MSLFGDDTERIPGLPPPPDSLLAQQIEDRAKKEQAKIDAQQAARNEAYNALERAAQQQNAPTFLWEGHEVQTRRPSATPWNSYPQPEPPKPTDPGMPSRKLDQSCVISSGGKLTHCIEYYDGSAAGTSCESSGDWVRETKSTPCPAGGKVIGENQRTKVYMY